MEFTPLQQEAKDSGDEELYLQLRALQMKEAVHGKAGLGICSTLDKLCGLLRARGRDQEALTCLQRSCQISQAHHGEHSTEAAVAMNNLGELLFAMGRFQSAETCLKRAVAALDAVGIQQRTSAQPEQQQQQQCGSPGHDLPADYASESPPCTEPLASLSSIPVRNLGLLYFATGQLDEAEPYLRRMLRIETRIHEPVTVGNVTVESAKIIPSLEILGYAMLHQGKYDEAADYFERAKRVAADAFGKESLAVARQTEFLALRHFVAGDFAAAEATFRQAHDTLLAAELDPFHEDVLRVCRNMATARCRLGPAAF